MTPEEIKKKVEQNPVVILELGAGKTPRGAGWITLDNNKHADFQHDLLTPFPFDANTFPTIYCSHLLEHFYYNQLITLLEEVRRILTPGGVFRVCVPDAAIYLNAYFDPDSFDPEFYCRHKPSFYFHSKIDYVNYMAYMNGNHKIMFDRENLPKILESTGFVNVRPRDYDPRFDLEKRDYESLYFIAEKQP